MPAVEYACLSEVQSFKEMCSHCVLQRDWVGEYCNHSNTTIIDTVQKTCQNQQVNVFDAQTQLGAITTAVQSQTLAILQRMRLIYSHSKC